MKDIEYFSREKLAGVRLLYSRIEAPTEAKAMFMSLFPYNVCYGFLQEYNATTADGLIEVKFWYGMTKYVLMFSPALFGLSRAVDRATGMSAWKCMYFDTISGKCLATSREEAANKLNQFGLYHLQQNEIGLAVHYFDVAAKNTFKENPERAALYMANLATAYHGSGCFKKAIAKADEAKKLSGNVFNAKADEIKTKAQVKLDAHQHYVKGKEIWDSAWRKPKDQPAGQKAERALRLLEAKAEFEKGCRLDESNLELNKALHVIQRSLDESLEFAPEDFLLAEASEVFGLAVNYEKIDEYRLTKEKLGDIEQILETVQASVKASPEKAAKYEQLIQEFQANVNGYLLLLAQKDQANTDASEKEDKEHRINKMQIIESFEYDRSYFSLLDRLLQPTAANETTTVK